MFISFLYVFTSFLYVFIRFLLVFKGLIGRYCRLFYVIHEVFYKVFGGPGVPGELGPGGIGETGGRGRAGGDTGRQAIGFRQRNLGSQQALVRLSLAKKKFYISFK